MAKKSKSTPTSRHGANRPRQSSQPRKTFRSPSPVVNRPKSKQKKRARSPPPPAQLPSLDDLRAGGPPPPWLAATTASSPLEELPSFGSYVQLHPIERSLREFCLTRLPQIVGDRFEVFGSYATPAVCTFQSDLDVVVVVPSISNDDKVCSKATAVTEEEEEETVQCPKQKRLQEKRRRVEKWAQALSEQPIVTSPKEDQPLFILDWKGNETEAVEITGDDQDSSQEKQSAVSSRDSADRLAHFASSNDLGVDAFVEDDDDHDSESEVDDLDDSVQEGVYRPTDTLEVSMFHRHTPATTSRQARQDVLDLLVSVSRKLRKEKWAKRVQVIRARVPIVKIQTRWNFCLDIGVAGHTGCDTSQYAATQTRRFIR
jgi:Nucleotidyltransferase domain